MKLRQVLRFTLFITALALCFGGAWQISPRSVAGQQAEPIVLQGAAALDQLKQDGQYESLQAAMNQARLSVRRAEATPLGRAAWHAPNDAAGYDAYVTENGVSIATSGENYVSLSLHGVGYGEALQGVSPGQVNGDKQTINIERDGLREWFINGPDGLEHGLTLAQPFGARHAGVPLRLAMQVSEGWRAVAGEDGKRVILRGADDQAIEYSKLVARDRLGRNIPARLAVADEQVVIEVEDHEAEYPLTIDPLFTLQQRLQAADGEAGAYLGFAVALDGNTAVLGAPYDDDTRGSAYVFVRNGATWTQQQKLGAQDGAAQDYFGWSVAIKGNTLVVGALYAPSSFGADQGAAYVFVRSGTTWTQQARLNANETLEGAQFGQAVALDGDTAIVGTPAYTIKPSFAVAGAAFVFVRSGTTWTQQARLIADDSGDGDTFGAAVALEGDTALVGAPNNAVTAGGQGAAYFFTRSGTTWTQQPRLLAIPTTVDANFGNAVALNGENALIGAYRYGSDDRGAAYSFRRTATGWAQTSQFFAPTPTADAQFGASIALKGDTAVIGASRGLFQPGADHRSAYVFVYSGDWNLTRQLGPELGTANDGFGYAVALSGDTVLIGAWRSDDYAADAADLGAGYTFVLHDSRHNERQKLSANDGKVFDDFGEAVALSGDTLAVGAWGYDGNTSGNQGAVYLFTRSGEAWTFQQKLTADDGAGGDNFGYAVALEGDTLAVGAYGDDIGGNADQGSAYVFTRNGTVWTKQQKLKAIAIDGLPNDYFGGSVALSGNTLAVGAWGQDNQRGSAYVFTRSGTTWTEQQKIWANDAAPGDDFGFAVGLDGDTLAVGAFRDTVGTNFQQGSVYIFTRTGTSWTQQPKLTANQGAAEEHFGSAIALKGDTLLVGAFGGGAGAGAKPGTAYVFARSGAAWNQTQKLTADNSNPTNFYGRSVALSGDILVVGAMGDNVGANSGRGAAYVYTRAGNWYRQQKLTASDGLTLDNFGSSVAISGDTIAVGAYGDDFGNNTDQGSAYIFTSPSCPAITIGPTSLSDATPGLAYNQPLTANGGSAGEYHFAVTQGELPPGITVQGDQGLAGIPTTPGTYTFTITATYYLSLCTGSREYTITVLPCPAITVSPATLPSGVLNAAYNQTVTATGGTGQNSFAVTAGAMPPGLSLSALGTLTGTPAQAGSYNFTVTATSNFCTGTRSYTLTILAVCPTLTVAPEVVPVGAVGSAYSQIVTTTGGAAPYLYGINLRSAPLPPGLSFFNSNGNGVLAGTPTQAGTYGILLRIKDANNCEVDKGYLVTINPPCPPITINPATLPGGTVGTAYSQTLTVSISTLGASFAVTAGALPPGLSLSTTGSLSGTPTQGGSYNFTVTASANGCTGTRSYTVTINPLIVNNGLKFYPLSSPVRLLDTRAGQQGCDAPGVMIQGGTSRTQTAAGRSCGGVTIPASAKALTGNITTVQSSGGYLTLYPSGAAQPLVANSNYGANEILNNVFTVGLGADGAFKIFVTSTTDVVVDVTGYYAPPDASLPGGLYFHPLPKPIRLLETRAGFNGAFTPGTPFSANADTPQQARVTFDGVTIPATALTIVGNATTVNNGAGFMTLYPGSVPRPLAASSNFSAGQVMNAPFTVGLSAAGEFNIFTTARTDLIIDVLGYYSTEATDANGAGLLFNPLASPVRLLETRVGFTGCNTPNAPLAAGSTRQQQARGVCGGQTIGADALAIVGNATVINNQASFLTFWPNGATQPLVASSNFAAGQILNRQFTVGLGATGQFNIFSSSQTDLIIDVSGFFAP